MGQGRVRVKVCCIASVEEAALAVRYGADAVGLVSAMPSGPGPIDEALIAQIRRTVPPPVATFLLTCLQDPDAVARQLRVTGCDTVQLCDEMSRADYRLLRAAAPAVRIVQVIHVTGPESIDGAMAVHDHVDAILLDSGRPSLAVKELGGTGRVHDWAVSRRIVERSRVPVFLAGGLDSDNVADAVGRVRPFGVDVCSGLRAGGKLDESKLARFMAAAGRSH